MGVFVLNDFDDDSFESSGIRVIPRSTAGAIAGELNDDVRRAERLARFLDAEFSILGFRFGADAIVGLLPIVGDAAGFLAGLYPIHVVRKHKLGRHVERRMLLNLMLDGIGGAVPILGDIFDAAFKANLLNVRLLKRAAARQRYLRSTKSRAVVVA